LKTQVHELHCVFPRRRVSPQIITEITDVLTFNFSVDWATSKCPCQIQFESLVMDRCADNPRLAETRGTNSSSHGLCLSGALCRLGSARHPNANSLFRTKTNTFDYEQKLTNVKPPVTYFCQRLSPYQSYSTAGSTHKTNINLRGL
jgi:hypothetical protein